MKTLQDDQAAVLAALLDRIELEYSAVLRLMERSLEREYGLVDVASTLRQARAALE
ncbi:hypothetical protein P2H44_06425 [Albimonas sp. CAU 1670]|uniref:hypothetical protein n=1 Tax=Albimonas sp. CAU 1670 TaxID=3032599 RepID=UPI0023D9ED05|nr:hypothetical protein [Albimonas sp. CAU 1670]MDF2232185.1 hypothetical protein [Albimonas sp. CAU 1670]